MRENCIHQELNGVTLGDKRLNQRFLKVAADLCSASEMPINRASEDAAATKGAYRLFANKKVDEAAILAPHQKQTQKRMELEKVALAIQDTVYLDYTHHPSKSDMGPIGTSKQALNGLVVHGTLITTTSGLPLGRLTQQIWAREKEDNQKAKNRKALPIKDKESQKWLTALEETVALTPAGVEVITICDRESDIYEFIKAAQELGTYILIRAGQNRILEDEEERIWDYMNALPINKKIKLKIPAKDKEPAREAQLEITYSSVEIKKPKGSVDEVDSVSLVAIWVKERNPPEGIKGIRWMLLTNLPVENSEAALQCIEWYKLRWRIEDYHRVIKSGCKVEDCRLETKDRIVRYFTLMSIIAWRLFWMTHINRVAGDTPCTIVITDIEWKALYCKINKTKIPPLEVPTTNEVIRWIAKLGGFLGRKNDGNPGMITIWRGWQRLTDIVEIWSMFNAS